MESTRRIAAPMKIAGHEPMNDFCRKLAEVLDVETVSEADALEDLPDWDSLSALSVIAMLDSEYGVNLTAMELRKIQTVAELAKLVERPRP
jgi:acyl carrier protein